MTTENKTAKELIKDYLFLKLNKVKYLGLVKTYGLQYDPISNYDMVEQSGDARKEGKAESTNSIKGGIVTDVDAGDFAFQLAEFFNGTLIPLDVENKIYRVVLEDKINYLDVTNPVENSLEKDILRRDLTINAIAVNIRTCEIFTGCSDFLDDLEVEEAVFLRFTSVTAFWARDEDFLSAITYLLMRWEKV